MSEAYSFAAHRKKMLLRDRLLTVIDKAGEATTGRSARIHRAMLDEVNDALRSRGRETIPLDTLERLERPALGHVDYASKFALYCAEYVVDGEAGPP